MASTLPNFNYDIFISYRQKDNKGDQWVTEFVTALNTELESAFKENVSVYFDVNPHDGLAVTHDVDDSLKEKLKCAIFIPVISQTYCDPKSFAWKNEFIAFKQSASQDSIGLKVKLQNGNVASRILPVRIHNLDATDKQLLETELAGPLRAVDFVYDAAGMTRPLLHNEVEPKANLEKTFYRDQVNKVVKGIKELLTAMQNPPAVGTPLNQGEKKIEPSSLKKKLSIAASAILLVALAGFILFNYTSIGKGLFKSKNKSIAVLPFENMNKDSTQDYFSNGMSEDILSHLVKIADLQVKSRTSTLQYKGTTKSMAEIGSELNVANIVEGSVRRVGDKVRIVVQLIDAVNDVHLWSETYDRDFKDVLSLQSEIAIEIAKALEAKLTESEKQGIEKEAATDVTAYDYFLKAKEFQRRGNLKRGDIENALALADKAIENDKTFAKAYALKAALWFDLTNYGLPESAWYDSVIQNADKAIMIDRTLGDGYLVKARVHRFLGKIEQGDDEIRNAYTVAPNNPEVLLLYGYLLLRERKEEGADLILKAAEVQYSPKDPEYYNLVTNAYFYTGDFKTLLKLAEQAKSLNPDAIESYLNLSYAYRLLNQRDKAIEELKAAEKINPGLPFVADQLAWTYFEKKDYTNAIKYWSKYPEFESQFEDTTQTVPFRHRLAMAYSKIDRKKEGDKLVKEDLRIQTELLNKKRGIGAWGGVGIIYYDLAVNNAYLGNNELAVQCLDSAWHYQFFYGFGYGNDPIFEDLKNRADFKKVIDKTEEWYQFNNKAFSSALNRAKAGKELKGLRDR